MIPGSVATVVSLLDRTGEGLGIVDAQGGFTWINASLRECPEAVRHEILAACRSAMEAINAGGAEIERVGQSRIVRFAVDECHYEATLSVASTRRDRVEAMVCTLQDVTAHHRIQKRIDAIDAAGTELLRLDVEAITQLNVADRLRLLEGRIKRSVQELLNFDHFEIRLIDRDTRQLELVFAIGLSPLSIGEAIYAEETDNGISGYVAATGQSYLCNDVGNDPRYTEGLSDAASALTVPLRLHDEVIGVFNVESSTPDAFDENDLRCAEIFGRYIAMAMHILDLLVVERYTTNVRLSGDVLGELAAPLARLSDEAEALAGTDADRAARIRTAVEEIRERLEACTSGPKSLIGAEQALRDGEVDPRLVGKRVVVADNEDSIRDGITNLLRRKGCAVTSCAGGAETIDALRDADARHEQYHLVISDIRMPDRNGYEVFRTAKALSPEMPVILMTGFGYDPHHSIVRASQEGLHAFLFKPLKATSLLENVVEAVAG
jgi:CheY-like chemotaxis protein/GAF domain-containing protein